MTARTPGNASRFLLLLAAGASLAGADETQSGRVSLAAQAPVVTVSGAPPGRHAVDLPTLEYTFDVTADCAGGGVPESLAINVADARVRLSASELAGASPQRLVLTVPASQTAPVALDDFCAAPLPITETPAPPVPPAEPAVGSTLEVPDVLSAQVSLVCSHGEERRMSWFSQPLAVTLACELPGPAGDPSSAGQ